MATKNVLIIGKCSLTTLISKVLTKILTGAYRGIGPNLVKAFVAFRIMLLEPFALKQ